MSSPIQVYSKVADMLLAIEGQLRHLGLWESEPPSGEHLQSTEPFCVDTLRFTQWLQFILIPRFKIMIESNQSLPKSCNIFDYAQEALKDSQQADFSQLLTLIKTLDHVLVSQ